MRKESLNERTATATRSMPRWGFFGASLRRHLVFPLSSSSSSFPPLFFIYLYIHIYISLYVYSAYSRSRKTFFLSDCLCNNQIIWFLPTWNIFVYTRPFSLKKKKELLLRDWVTEISIIKFPLFFFLPSLAPEKKKKGIITDYDVFLLLYVYFCRLLFFYLIFFLVGGSC